MPTENKPIILGGETLPLSKLQEPSEMRTAARALPDIMAAKARRAKSPASQSATEDVSYTLTGGCTSTHDGEDDCVDDTDYAA